MPRRKREPPAGGLLGQLSAVSTGEPPAAEQPPPPAPAAPDAVLDDRDPVQELRELLDAGTGQTVTIYRYKERGPAEYIDRVNVSDFDPIQLRQKWGGGRFLVRFTRPDGRLGVSKTITIAPEPLPAGAPAAPGSDDWKQLARDLLLRDRGNGGMDFSGLAQMIATMQASAMQQTVAMLGIFKEMMPRAVEPLERQSPTELLDTVRGLMELQSELRASIPVADGDGDVNPLVLLQPLLPTLGKALETWTNAQASAAHPAPNGARGLLGAGAAGPAAPEPVPVVAPDRPEGGRASAPGGGDGGAQPEGARMSGPPSPLMVLKPYVAQLVKLSDQGADPELWGDMAGARGGPELDMVERFMDRMGDEAFRAELVRLFPEVTLHQDWLVRFLDAALASEDDGEDGEDGELDNDPNELRHDPTAEGDGE